MLRGRILINGIRDVFHRSHVESALAHSRPNSMRIRDWSLLILGTGPWKEYDFFSKKLITHPDFPLNFHTPSENLPKLSYPNVYKLCVLIIFTIFKNSIKNKFKDKHLTTTYNWITLSIKESSHVNYVQY